MFFAGRAALVDVAPVTPVARVGGSDDERRACSLVEPVRSSWMGMD